MEFLSYPFSLVEVLQQGDAVMFAAKYYIKSLLVWPLLMCFIGLSSQSCQTYMYFYDSEFSLIYTKLDACCLIQTLWQLIISPCQAKEQCITYAHREMSSPNLFLSLFLGKFSNVFVVVLFLQWAPPHPDFHQEWALSGLTVGFDTLR